MPVRPAVLNSAGRYNRDALPPVDQHHLAANGCVFRNRYPLYAGCDYCGPVCGESVLRHVIAPSEYAVTRASRPTSGTFTRTNSWRLIIPASAVYTGRIGTSKPIHICRPVEPGCVCKNARILSVLVIVLVIFSPRDI